MTSPKEKVYVVYCITHKTSGKKYIGQSFDVERRWREHKNARNLTSENNTNKSYSSLVHNAVAKYGVDDFTFEIVENCTADNICEREIHHIEVNDCLHPRGYNLLKGGRGASGGHHAETRKKMSESHKGKIITDITKARMSAARMGEKNPAFGGDGTFVKPVAQYDLNGTYIKSYPSCSAAAKALKCDARRQIIASSALGGQKTAYGYQWREKDDGSTDFPASVEKHIIGQYLNRRAVISIDENDVEQRYNSVNDAARLLNIKGPNISAALKNPNARTKGYRWKYADNTDKAPEITRMLISDGSIEHFQDIKLAAKSVNTVPSKIRICLDKPHLSMLGYRWATKPV